MMQSQPLLRANTLLAMLICCLFGLLTPAMAAELVGKVIVASGQVQAQDAEGTLRKLKRRSPVYEGDTLLTGANSRAQIRFKDGALIALRADSQFELSSYQFNSAQGGEDKAVMKLVSGGFRTITGQIGKADKEDYQVSTPVASIGIRGTNYEAVLVDSSVYAGVWQGGVTVENDQGSLNLGADSDFSFVQVDPGQPPKGLLAPPTALGQPLAGGDGEEGGEGDGEESEEGGDGEGDGGEEGGDGEGDSGGDGEGDAGGESDSGGDGESDAGGDGDSGNDAGGDGQDSGDAGGDSSEGGAEGGPGGEGNDAGGEGAGGEGGTEGGGAEGGPGGDGAGPGGEGRAEGGPGGGRAGGDGGGPGGAGPAGGGQGGGDGGGPGGGLEAGGLGGGESGPPPGGPPPAAAAAAAPRVEVRTETTPSINQAEQINEEGDLAPVFGSAVEVAADGTRFERFPDGRVNVASPDGTTAVITPNGQVSISGSNGSSATANVGSGFLIPTTSGGLRIGSAQGGQLLVAIPGGDVRGEGFNGPATITAPNGAITQLLNGTTTINGLNGFAVVIAPQGAITVTPGEGTPQAQVVNGQVVLTAADNSAQASVPAGSIVLNVAQGGTINLEDPTQGQATISEISGDVSLIVVEGALEILAPGSVVTLTDLDGTQEVRTPDGVVTTTFTDGRIVILQPNQTVTTIEEGVTRIEAVNGFSATTDAQGNVSVIPGNGQPQLSIENQQLVITAADGSARVVATTGSALLAVAEGQALTLVVPGQGTITVSNNLGPVTVRQIEGDLDVVAPQGIVTFLGLDGIQIVVQDGVTTETRPDNTVIVTSADGTRTQTDAEGNVAVTSPDGTITETRVDGTVITISVDGVITTRLADGTTIIDNPDGSRTQETPDGVVTQTLVDGTQIEIQPDGLQTTTFPDGTTERVNLDGSILVTEPSGRTRLTLTDGTQVVNELDGSIVTITPDGLTSTLLTDGTIIVVDATGVETVTQPDGTITVTTVDGTITSTDPNGIITITAPDGTVTVIVPDPRLAQAERDTLTRTGIVAGKLSNAGIPGRVLIGKSNGIEAGVNLLLAANDANPSDAAFTQQPEDFVLRSENVILSEGDVEFNVLDFPVTWGRLPASDTNPVTLTNLQGDVFNLTDPLLFLTAEPEDIASLDGSAFFASGGSVERTFIADPDVQVEEFILLFDVNFGTGAVDNGILFLATENFAEETRLEWDVDFAGQISNGVFASNSLSGEVQGDDFNSIDPPPIHGVGGSIDGLFTRRSDTDGGGLGFAGVFDLFDADPEPIYSSVTGAFIVEPELRFSSAEIQAFELETNEVFALGLIGNDPQDSFIGYTAVTAEQLEAGQFPIFTNDLPNTDSLSGLFIADTFDDQTQILRTDGFFGSTFDPDVGGRGTLSWGIFAGGAISVDATLDQLDGIDPTPFDTVDAPSVVVLANPLEVFFDGVNVPFDFATPTGSFISSQDLLGFAGTGAFTLRTAFDIDFRTGQVFNGELLAQVFDSVSLSEIWSAEYQGQIADGIFKQTFFSNAVIFDALGNQIDSFNGSLLGLLVDSDDFNLSRPGETFALGFDLVGSSNPNLTLTGAVILEQENRITANEFFSVGNLGFFALERPAGVTAGLAGIDDASNLPFIISNDLGLNDPVLAGQLPASFVLRSGAASVDSLSDVRGFNLTWGFWDGTFDQPISSQTDRFDPSIADGIIESAFFTSVAPTDVSTLSGSLLYFTGGDTLDSFFVRSAVDGIEQFVGLVDGRFAIDFNTGAITDGRFNILTTDTSGDFLTHLWEIGFDGQVVNQGLSDLNLVEGLLDGTPFAFSASSDIDGVFTGASAEGFASVFSFGIDGQEVDNFVTGGALFEAETRIAAEEFAAVDRAGFVVSQELSTITPTTIVGGASTDAASGSPVLIAPFPSVSTPAPILADPSVSRPDLVIRQVSGGVTEGLQTFDLGNGFELTWGAWNQDPSSPAGSTLVQGVDSDLNVTQALLTDPTFFVSAQPTDIANLVGTATYSGVSAFIGGGSAGQLTGVNAGFNVDFNSGFVSNGFISTVGSNAGPGNTFNADFDGQVIDGVVNSLSITNGLIDGNAANISGNVGGFFSGQAGEHFVGGFTLEDAVNPAIHVEGLFISPQGSPP